MTRYETGIHEFGAAGAANLTDKRYSYRDDAGGVYAYFAREKAEAPAAGTASAFAGGQSSPVAVGAACLAAGAAAGAGATYAALRRRREE